MSDGHGEQLSRRQEQAIAALLEHASVTAAAASIGPAEKTRRNWLKRPEFARAYRQARGRLVEDALGRVQKAAQAAAVTLARNLRCGRPGDEIKAAAIILEHATKAVELGDLLQRVEDLERQLLEQGKANSNG